MKAWIKKNAWWLLIVTLPILLIILLHIGLAFSLYTDISFNIENITAKDWFVFMGSYLAGVVTLIGVRLTIQTSMQTHSHQISIQSIEKEQDVLSVAISQINPNEPVNIFKIYFALLNQKSITSYDKANLHDRLNTQQNNISSIRARVFIESNICDINPSCNTCTTPCRLKNIVPDFSNTFEHVTKTIHETLELLKKYINDCTHNAVIYERIEKEQNDMEKDKLQKEIVNTIHDGEKLEKLCAECSSFNSKEFSSLMGLIKQYISERKINAQKACFK